MAMKILLTRYNSMMLYFQISRNVLYGSRQKITEFDSNTTLTPRENLTSPKYNSKRTRQTTIDTEMSQRTEDRCKLMTTSNLDDSNYVYVNSRMRSKDSSSIVSLEPFGRH